MLVGEYLNAKAGDVGGELKDEDSNLSQSVPAAELTDTELNDLRLDSLEKQKKTELQSIIERLNVRLSKKERILKTGNKKDLAHRIMDSISRYRRAQDEETPAQDDNPCIKTWFMPPVSATNRPALTLGSENEQYVRSTLRHGLPSDEVLHVDTREFGLHENREHPYICCSTDAISLMYDRSTREIRPIIHEIKTKTTTETINKSQHATERRFNRIDAMNTGLVGVDCSLE
jgi:hypothetical protein